MLKLSILSAFFNEEQYVDKLLDSVPRRDCLEIIARDDASTDGTFAKLQTYKEAHPELNLRVLHDDVNHGCFYNANRLLEAATGEYIHFLDGDDYLYTDAYNAAIDQLDGTDCVYIDLIINSGMRFALVEGNRRGFCAPTTKFVRRAFAEGIRFKEDERNAGDWFYNEELLARNPTCKYTRIAAYHYNHPREGSIYDLLSKGL
jgi:glycosyltransferase involved in cell wall biosynthesis